MSGTVHIFSNGFEFECWSAANCDRCVKVKRCSLLNGKGGIVDSFADGLFSQKAADRMGFKPENKAVLGWRCAEFSDQRPPSKPRTKRRAAGEVALPGLEVQP